MSAVLAPLRDPDVDVVVGRHMHVLRHRDGGDYEVNETALALWELCDGTTTPEEMVAAAGALFDVAPDRLAADVTAALAHLDELGLLHWTVREGGDP